MDSTLQSPSRGGCSYHCCCCFPIACDRIRILSSSDETRPEETPRPRKRWRSAVETLVKARKWSEIVAGPKWKNFIRRFNRKGSGGVRRFGYDPLSYSLNFDGGGGSPDRDFGFSTRFVVPPGSGKASMVVDGGN